jgi:hypothetical protein
MLSSSCDAWPNLWYKSEPHIPFPLLLRSDMKATQTKIDVKGKTRDELMGMTIRDLKKVHAGCLMLSVAS